MSEAPTYPHATIEICPGGPMLVRNAGAVRDADGTMHEVDKPIVALCRCQKSAVKPWCDGTHKLLPPQKRPK